MTQSHIIQVSVLADPNIRIFGCVDGEVEQTRFGPNKVRGTEKQT